MKDDEPKPTDPTVVNNYVTNIEKHSINIEWENLTWIFVAVAAASVICTLIWATAAFNIDRNEKMSEAIKGGSHPMDVYCAFDGSSDNKVCLVRGAKGAKDAG